MTLSGDSSWNKRLEDFLDKSNSEHPFFGSLEESSVEKNAHKQDSDLYCPYCKINLPYSELTVLPATMEDMRDTNWKQKYFCTLCDEDFYKGQED